MDSGGAHLHKGLIGPNRRAVNPRRPAADPSGVRLRAFTLIEVMLAVAILAFAVAAVAQAISAAQAQTDASLHDLRAVSLAEAMIEEVLAKPYADPDGIDAEFSRSAFDDADDYDGFQEAAGALQDAAGVAYAAPYQRFDRSVAVTPQTLNIPGFGGAVAGLNVVVTVTDAGRAWTLTRFIPEPVAGLTGGDTSASRPRRRRRRRRAQRSRPRPRPRQGEGVMMRMSRPSRRRGLTLVELLIGLAITGIVGAAIASMLFGAARGTDAANDRRAAMVRLRTATTRLAAAIRGSHAVLAADDDLLVLWIDDFDADGRVAVAELRRIERDEATDTLRSFTATDNAPATSWDPASDFEAITDGLVDKSYFPAEPWATGVTDWSISLDDPDPQQATLVSYRLRIETDGGASADEVIASAALRNAP